MELQRLHTERSQPHLKYRSAIFLWGVRTLGHPRHRAGQPATWLKPSAIANTEGTVINNVSFIM